MKIINNLGYDYRNMAFEQLRKVGQAMNARIVVTGELYTIKDTYFLCIRVVDITTGSIVILKETCFDVPELRKELTSFAKEIASKVCNL